jgi:hypothetical protein
MDKLALTRQGIKECIVSALWVNLGILPHITVSAEVTWHQYLVSASVHGARHVKAMAPSRLPGLQPCQAPAAKLPDSPRYVRAMAPSGRASPWP